MQRPVMVALDGSDKDARAVAVAMAIAKLSHGSLHFVRVIGGLSLDELAAQRISSEAELDRIASGAGRDGRAATFAVLHSDDAGAELIRQAVDRDALVVVVATRARRGTARTIIGSVADHVVRECPRPVMVVPPEAGFLGGKDMTITRVLVPLDGSSLAFHCLEFLIRLPHATELEYILVEVIRDESHRRAANERLKTTAAWLRSRGPKAVETHAVDGPDAAAAILGTVRDALPDVIAMSTRGQGGLKRMMLGSVAQDVVRDSVLPVLLLTPRVLAAASH